MTELQRAVCRMLDGKYMMRVQLDEQWKRQVDELESEGELSHTPKGGYLTLSDFGREWMDSLEVEDTY